MKLYFWPQLLVAAMTLIFQSEAAHAQQDCQLFDNFSSQNGWTQVGELVTIANGEVQYQNGAPDAEQRRVYKNLGVSLTANHTWTANIDFTPESVGDYGGPHAGHAIISLTAGTQEPLSNCPDPPECTGYPTPQQDGILCFFGSISNPSDGNSYFLIRAIEGTTGTEYVSTAIVANALQVTYFVLLERENAALVKLSVFSDAAHTNHLAGSPVTLIIPASIEGLNTVQHGNVARGGPYRELTGTVDNLCIKWNASDSCPPDRSLLGIVGSEININTGVDANLNVLPFGAIDPRWNIVSNTLAPMKTEDRWNFTQGASQWISFDGSDIQTNYKVGFTFCSKTCGDFQVNFRLMADNGACVYLDGAPVPSSWWPNNVPMPDCNYNPGDQSPFIPTAGYLIDYLVYLSAGEHFLEIDVTNFSFSPTGINILGKITQVSPCSTIAVHELGAKSGDLQLFPNPAQDQMTINWKNSAPQNLSISDVLGRTLRTINLPEGMDRAEISLMGLAPGTYFLFWADNAGRKYSKRFVKM